MERLFSILVREIVREFALMKEVRASTIRLYKTATFVKMENVLFASLVTSLTKLSSVNAVNAVTMHF